MRSLHPADAVRKGFGTIPTSILQRKIAFVYTSALLAGTMSSMKQK